LNIADGRRFEMGSNPKQSAKAVLAKVVAVQEICNLATITFSCRGVIFAVRERLTVDLL
jgi:hypothetical protein